MINAASIPDSHYAPSPYSEVLICSKLSPTSVQAALTAPCTPAPDHSVGLIMCVSKGCSLTPRPGLQGLLPHLHPPTPSHTLPHPCLFPLQQMSQPVTYWCICLGSFSLTRSEGKTHVCLSHPCSFFIQREAWHIINTKYLLVPCHFLHSKCSRSTYLINKWNPYRLLLLWEQVSPYKVPFSVFG